MRSNGVASRRQILDAAAAIASERGYQGTSISAVSKRSGLPNSSIYWHFENKEALFTAVINDSYERWRTEIEATRSSAEHADGPAFEWLYASLGEFPDFIRLGLIMTLERAPDGDGTARQRFFEIREESLTAFRGALIRDHPHLDPTQADALAAMTFALLDGSFIAAIAGETTPTPKMLSSAIHTLATSMRNE
jgi:AcrR family transcriptional regulator